MLKLVAIDQLRPNPFRRLDEYPILRDKVDALKESIQQTGFWGTIVGRPKGDDFEIAFGHHRRIALQEAGIKKVEIIVRDLSNEDMLRMMARENMEEWGTSAWVEVETIRSTIETYGKGEIELPKVPKDTPKTHIRYVAQGSVQRPFTETTVAVFLGWTRKRGNGLQPNYACETAFSAIDAIDDGLLSEADIKGLQRAQLDELVRGLLAIQQAEKREAKQNAESAKLAKKRAAEAGTEDERRRQESQAKVYEEQAETHEQQASRKAKDFGQEGASMFRGGEGTRAVRGRAQELKPQVESEVKVHQIDDLADRIAKDLERFVDKGGRLSEDMKLLKANLGDLSERAANGLRGSFDKLIASLERMRDAVKSTSSHVDGTRSDRGRHQLANGKQGSATE